VACGIDVHGPELVPVKIGHIDFTLECDEVVSIGVTSGGFRENRRGHDLITADI
jgi:hypothetical protein